MIEPGKEPSKIYEQKNFYWDFSNNFDNKSDRYFWLFSTTVMIEPGKEPSKIYEQKK